MRHLGFSLILLSVAIAEPLFLGFAPPILPDPSLFSIPEILDIDSDSNPVNIDPVASTSSLSNNQFTFPLASDILSVGSQNPNDDIASESSIERMDPMEPATIVNAQNNPDYSLPLCSSVSMSPGRKLRRRQACVTLQMRLDQIKNWASDFFGLGGGKDEKRDPTTPEEIRIGRISTVDEVWGDRMTKDPKNPFWQKSQEDPCSGEKSSRRGYCCLGPPVSTGSQKRAEALGVDMENCKSYLPERPFCIIRKKCQFCCEKLDFEAPTFRGWTGRSCIPMWPTLPTAPGR